MNTWGIGQHLQQSIQSANTAPDLLQPLSFKHDTFKNDKTSKLGQFTWFQSLKKCTIKQISGGWSPLIVRFDWHDFIVRMYFWMFQTDGPLLIQLQGRLWIIWKNGSVRNRENLQYKKMADSVLLSLFMRTNGNCNNFVLFFYFVCYLLNGCMLLY